MPELAWYRKNQPKATNHANRGKEFENELKATHEFYLLRGLADIVQNPNAWDFCNANLFNAIATKNPHGVAKTAAGSTIRRIKSNVDFSGGGNCRTFIFDAKQTTGQSFPLAKVEEHQIVRLRRSAKCGNTAGLMIKFSELDRVFWIDADTLEERYTAWKKQPGKAARGTASLSIADLEANGVEIARDRINGLWDWLRSI